MSTPSRQLTCAVCGKPLANTRWHPETLIDDIVRAVAVHDGETTHPIHPNTEAAP